MFSSDTLEKLPFTTRETVITLTPASRAISFRVTISPSFLLQLSAMIGTVMKKYLSIECSFVFWDNDKPK
jgi:hypothetical protein